MPHVPRTTLHVYQGRRSIAIAGPIAGRLAAEVGEARFVVDGEVSIVGEPSDTTDGLIITVEIEEEVTAPLAVGMHEWQILATDTLHHLLEPFARGALIVSGTASVPEEESP